MERRSIVRVALIRRLARTDRVVNRFVDRLRRERLAEMIRQLIEGAIGGPVQLLDCFGGSPMDPCTLGLWQSLVDRVANQSVRESVAPGNHGSFRHDPEIDRLLQEIDELFRALSRDSPKESEVELISDHRRDHEDRVVLLR
jgi:hypothetical protein